MKFVIEHFGEEFCEWSQIEYFHSTQIVNPENLILTCFPFPLPHSFPPILTYSQSAEKVFPVDRIVLLDEKATQPLTPSDADLFDCVLFGGILGDPISGSDTSKQLRDKGYALRHLGPIQMPTDTAVHVTHKILVSKQSLDSLPFIDNPEIRFSKHECVEMPFRYLKDLDNLPILGQGMRSLLQKQNNESF